MYPTPPLEQVALTAAEVGMAKYSKYSYSHEIQVFTVNIVGRTVNTDIYMKYRYLQ